MRGLRAAYDRHRVDRRRTAVRRVTRGRRVVSSVVLGSANPAKRRGVEAALDLVQPGRRPDLRCIEVASGVRAQPWGDDETLQGAGNRAAAALARMHVGLRPAQGDRPQGHPTQGDGTTVAIGIEGGLARVGPVVWSFSWAVALDAGGGRGAARSAAFALPARVTALVDAGTELGDAIDRVFGVHGSKRAGGAVGLLTAGALDRSALYAPMVVLALMPLLRRELYGDRPPG